MNSCWLYPLPLKITFFINIFYFRHVSPNTHLYLHQQYGGCYIVKIFFSRSNKLISNCENFEIVALTAVYWIWGAFIRDDNMKGTKGPEINVHSSPLMRLTIKWEASLRWYAKIWGKFSDGLGKNLWGCWKPRWGGHNISKMS